MNTGTDRLKQHSATRLTEPEYRSCLGKVALPEGNGQLSGSSCRAVQARPHDCVSRVLGNDAKAVHAWPFGQNCDPCIINSNTIVIDWPPSR